ncbi:MAG: SusC/RagA family TonB-linked outer membrane protein [Saprospiraceae bacterium]
MKRFLTTMFLALVAFAVSAQRPVSGNVITEDGEPLIGATVVAKGTTAGAVTDVNGSFRFMVPNNATTLMVSYSGFQSVEVPIGDGSGLSITMSEGLALQEAVVTAFGVKKDKSNLGYAVTELSAEQLTVARATNVTNALAAKIPGVRLQGSGGSFTGSNILIRGYTTFTGSNQPLFVVDGIPVDNSGGGTPLQNGPATSNRAIDFNQEDIESITVLKGAAATALYGSRAAGGVILINTKKGKAGQKRSVSYTTNFAFQEVNRLPDLQNTYGQGNGGNFNPTAIGSWGPRMDGRNVPLPPGFSSVVGRDSVPFVAYPNNVRDIFRRGSNMQHNLSFQGSTSGSNHYRLSLGYLDDQGPLDNNRLQRYNVGLNAGSAITSRLSADVSINYAFNKSNRTQQGNQLSNPLFRSYFTPRSWDLAGLPYQNAVGNQLHYDPQVDNPFWSIYNNLFDDQTNRIFGNVGFRLQLTDWLSANYKVGADYYSFVRHGYDQIGARGGANTSAQGQGGILEGREINRVLNSYLTLNGTRSVGDFTFDFILGQETVDNFNDFSQLIGRTLNVRNFRNISNALTFVPSYSIGRSRILGVFGNLTTVYRNFATLDLSVRNDWNSTLPVNNRSYLYYSAAGTLNLTEAIPSLKSDWVSLLKLRANYGRTGRASLLYSTDTYYGQANPADGFGPNIQFPFGGRQGFTYFNAAGNPNLGPEFTTSQEVGIDLSLLKDRLSVELTRYNMLSTDIILSVPVSGASGVTNVVLNAGELETKGWEAGVTITPIKTRNGMWSSTFNFTQFKSIVKSLAPGVDNIFLGGFVTPNTRLVVNDEYGQLYGNKYQRNADGDLLLNPNGLLLPGANVEKIGNPNPRWLLGVNNDISYKGFNLNVLLDIRVGGDQYSRNLADIRRQGVGIETAEFDRFDSDGALATPYKFEGVFASGPNAGQRNEGQFEKRLTAEQYWGNNGVHVAAEGFIYDISWFRIREAQFSYTFSKGMLNNTPLGALTVGVFGRNLFLHAPNYPHLDPEQNALGISNAQGLEFNALPAIRSYGVNLSVTF